MHHELNNIYPFPGFWLGQVRQIQGDYSNAILAYKIFSSEHFRKILVFLLLQKEILACEWAIEQVKYPIKRIEHSKLSDQIIHHFLTLHLNCIRMILFTLSSL